MESNSVSPIFSSKSFKMKNALESRNEMLLKTASLLENVIKNAGGDAPIELKSTIRTVLLLKSANLFDDVEMIMDIKGRMMDLIQYSNKTYLFDFKVSELINDLRGMVTNDRKQLFNYN